MKNRFSRLRPKRSEVVCFNVSPLNAIVQEASFVFAPSALSGISPKF